MAGYTGSALYLTFGGTVLDTDYRDFSAGEEIGTTDHVWEPAARVYEDEANARGRIVLAVARLMLVVAVVLAWIMTVVGIVLPFVRLLFWF